jgi:hypothetical protein
MQQLKVSDKLECGAGGGGGGRGGGGGGGGVTSECVQRESYQPAHTATSSGYGNAHTRQHVVRK